MSSTARPTRTDAPGSTGRLGRSLAWAAGLLAVAGLLLVLVAGFLGGWRMFILTTPSMGTALPVGSLVVTRPADIADLSVGDVVTADSAGDATHTHRVVEIAPDRSSLRTQGDLNGSVDPLPVTPGGIVGREVFSAPVLGWIVRMVPIVALGWLIVWLVTRGIRDGVNRNRYRVVGFFCAFALSLVIVKPLVGVSLLAMSVSGQGEDSTATAHTVSTGLFPLRVDPEGEGGESTRVLSPTGTDGTATAVGHNENGQFSFQPRLALDWRWWLGIIALVLSPVAWFYGQYRVVRRREEGEDGEEPATGNATTEAVAQ